MIDPQVERVYDRRARFYDGMVRPMSLGRDNACRRRAVEAPGLCDGDRVSEIGRGTGSNARYRTGWCVRPHLPLLPGGPDPLLETLQALRPCFEDPKVWFGRLGMVHTISAVRR